MKKLFALWMAFLLVLSGCTHGESALEPEGPIHLTLGCLYLDGTGVEPVIQDFNKSQDRIVVEVKKYLNDDITFEQAKSLLATEILSGNPPDLIFFPQLRMDGEATFNEFSPLPFIGKGLLLDMDPFIEQDPALKSEDFAIWNALHEYGGLYLLSNSYTLQTAICTQEFYEQHKGWSFQEFLEIEKNLKPGQTMFSSIDPVLLLLSMGARYMRGAMDLQHAACSFDTPEFISILKEVQNVVPVEFEFSMERPAQKQLVDGDFLFSNAHIYSPNDMSFDRARSGGERLAYIGWPTMDGSNGTDVRLVGAMGISAGTEHPEECWELVRYYVTNWTCQRYPDGAPADPEGFGTPVYLPEMPKCMDIVEKHSFRFGNDIVQEDIDQFLDIAVQCDRMNYYNPVAMALIEEEVKEMMDSKATPEKTAKKIQARVSLYMQEKYG